MLYNSYDVTLENFVSDQLIISSFDIFLQSHHLSAWCCKEIFCLGHSWHGSLMFSELIVSLMLWREQLIINLNKRKSWRGWNIKKKRKITITFVTFTSMESGHVNWSTGCWGNIYHIWKFKPHVSTQHSTITEKQSRKD